MHRTICVEDKPNESLILVASQPFWANLWKSSASTIGQSQLDSEMLIRSPWQ
jgi:hypothetical protein